MVVWKRNFIHVSIRALLLFSLYRILHLACRTRVYDSPYKNTIRSQRGQKKGNHCIVRVSILPGVHMTLGNKTLPTLWKGSNRFTAHKWNHRKSNSQLSQLCGTKFTNFVEQRYMIYFAFRSVHFFCEFHVYTHYTSTHTHEHTLRNVFGVDRAFNSVMDKITLSKFFQLFDVNLNVHRR